MSRSYRSVRVPDYRLTDVPEGMWEVAHSRTEHIMVVMPARLSLRDLVANAYLQGVSDTLDVAMTDRGRDALAKI